MCDYDPDINFIFDKETGTITKYIGNLENCNIADCIDGVEVKSIGEKAFANCEYLVSVKIPNSIINIEKDAFSKCESLVHVELPESITMIKRGVFAYCKSLKKITIPSSVISIGDMAFAKCSGLEEIDIPSTVTELGRLPFSLNPQMVICCDANSEAHVYAKGSVKRYKLNGSNDVIISSHPEQNSVTKLIDNKYEVTYVDDRVFTVSLDRGGEGSNTPIVFQDLNTLQISHFEDHHLSLIDYLYDFGDQLGDVEELRMSRCSPEIIHTTLSCHNLFKIKRIIITKSMYFTSLPPSIGNYSFLEFLDLSKNFLFDLPEELGGLKRLQSLDISGNHITNFPDNITRLESLMTLEASNNFFYELPYEFSKLTELEDLILTENHFKSIPPELKKMEMLKVIRLNRNILIDIPDEYSELKRKGIDIIIEDINPGIYEIGGIGAVSLDLEHKGISKLIDNSLSTLMDNKYTESYVNDSLSLISLNRSGSYTCIVFKDCKTIAMNHFEDRHLDLIDYLYDFGDQVGAVEQLLMTNCSSEIIDKTLSCHNLSKIKRLEIIESHSLNTLPNVIANYSCLDFLNLSDNRLTLLPEELGGLSRLKFLDISKNNFTKLPDSVTGLESLEHIDASHNSLDELPHEFSKLSKLEALILDCNAFKCIPAELLIMEMLEIVDLNRNKIMDTPDEFSELKAKGIDITINGINPTV